MMEHETVRSGNTVSTIKAATAAQPVKKKAHVFEWVLVYLAVLIVLIGGYESVTEKYYPGLSILSLLHSYGYLKHYPIIYEPSKGIWHPLGWTGSAMMVVMMLYSVRKRVGALSSLGSMRYWLHGHMFLGIMGPLLVTLHTTFKFGGLIATSFWCMIVTMVFGILGRYIYVQIPRSLNGTELDEKDIEKAIEELDRELGESLGGAKGASIANEIHDHHAAAKRMNSLSALLVMMKSDIANIFRIRRLKKVLSEKYKLDRQKCKEAAKVLNEKAVLIRRKNLLFTSHKLLHHWHVLHVPLAGVMFLIMFLHIIVYYLFRAMV